MIILASNGSGKLSSVFEGDVFKKVLSIFITAAILKLVQGRKPVERVLLVHYLFLISCMWTKLYLAIFFLFIASLLLVLYLCSSALEN